VKYHPHKLILIKQIVNHPVTYRIMDLKYIKYLKYKKKYYNLKNLIGKGIKQEYIDNYNNELGLLLSENYNIIEDNQNDGILYLEKDNKYYLINYGNNYPNSGISYKSPVGEKSPT
jgi:hypothetical protein